MLKYGTNCNCSRWVVINVAHRTHSKSNSFRSAHVLSCPKN
jgi:hypothetical protein